MNITEVEKEDLEIVKRLIELEFSYFNSSVENLRERLENPNIFLFKLVERNGIIGFVDLELLDSIGRVNAISVVKHRRGKRLGEHLLDFGINFLKEKNVSEIKLIVKAENRVAKSLYGKFGFHSTGILSQKIENSTVEEMSLPLKSIFSRPRDLS
ncbi:MAG: GNAT family N-acetyltransferase [Candidatus Diapherotrites archaeon]|uniref:GNAT family N-acetyltransferase n=1 Tax=Candidatus Iainarchaeum sp. TaxID=3101447 RepID=A0A7J4ITI0_9ARCH|nr:MAG: hypothetical protein QT03_C0001G0087 [archaeon GW2011_AR10]MBS3059253.1 GNAT family N-acetyltransferase [Candidatus Diapherotrites archaeon]HIH08762.1 GNAT family N-acetyltransferase [Candidatus Diapherotrites archaeon]